MASASRPLWPRMGGDRYRIEVNLLRRIPPDNRVHQNGLTRKGDVQSSPLLAVQLPTTVTLTKVGLQPSKCMPRPLVPLELSAIKAFLTVPSAW
jgi:hypothetical protein